MLEKERIMAAGFDLDGTLYESTSEMNGRVRTRIAERMLEKMNSLGSVQNARKEFEKRYSVSQSGTGVLRGIGYENAGEVMDDCIATAKITDLIVRDESLNDILGEIQSKWFTYLITSSPEVSALEKLDALGISTSIFSERVYSDTPNAGSKSKGEAFRYLLSKTDISAERHVYIGDREKSDILPAKNIGMQTIAVWSEIPSATVSIKNMSELRGLLL